MDFGQRGIVWDAYGDEPPGLPEGTTFVKAYAINVEPVCVRLYCQETWHSCRLTMDSATWSQRLLREFGVPLSPIASQIGSPLSTPLSSLATPLGSRRSRSPLASPCESPLMQGRTGRLDVFGLPWHASPDGRGLLRPTGNDGTDVVAVAVTNRSHVAENGTQVRRSVTQRNQAESCQNIILERRGYCNASLLMDHVGMSSR